MYNYTHHFTCVFFCTPFGIKDILMLTGKNLIGNAIHKIGFSVVKFSTLLQNELVM